MSGQPGSSDRLLGFLLGTLPEPEREQLERKLLSDDALCEQLAALEDELIHDQAAAAEPSPELEPLLERLRGSAAGRRRLAAARQLMTGLRAARRGGRGVGALPSRASSALLAAAALLVLALGVAWLRSAPPSGDRMADGDGSRPLPAATAPTTDTTPDPGPAASPPPGAARPAARPSIGPAAGPPVAPLTVVAATLFPGLVRGATEAVRVELGGAVAVLRLHLALPSAPPAGDRRYRATLLSADQEELWSGPAVASAEHGAAAAVQVDLPAAVLPEGDYELTLAAQAAAGLEPVADYAFGVLRTP